MRPPCAMLMLLLAIMLLMLLLLCRCLVPYQGPHYMELDVNIASSSVAAGVVRLAAGYAKTLVVDIGLVIQVRRRRHEQTTRRAATARELGSHPQHCCCQ